MSKAKSIIVDVTEEQHQHELSEGLLEDETMSVGTHVFTRGGFRERHSVYKPKESKLRINICLDADIVQHFRNRAALPNSAPYQTQINNELRSIMERDLQSNKFSATGQELLEDDDFLRALANRVGEIAIRKA